MNLKLDKSEDSPIVRTDHNEDQMQAAYLAARKTFKYFWREVFWEQRRIIPGLGMAAVKAAFRDADGDESAEHMWINDVHFDGVKIYGTLINQPNWLEKYAIGDDVEVTMDQLEDWMYADYHDTVYGGYTVDAMRDQMTPAARRTHDKAWGLNFGEPGVIEVVPNPNKPEPEKIGFLGKLLGKKPAPLPAFDPVDPNDEHPMSENAAPAYKEQIQEEPEILNLPDENGWTQLHHMALGGNLSPVKVMLELGADKAAKTNDGHTALDLARILNWEKVISVLS